MPAEPWQDALDWMSALPLFFTLVDLHRGSSPMTAHDVLVKLCGAGIIEERSGHSVSSSGIGGSYWEIRVLDAERLRAYLEPLRAKRCEQVLLGEKGAFED